MNTRAGNEAPICQADVAPLAPLAQQFLEAILRGERQRASRMILDAVNAGVSVKEIYLHVFQRSQQEVGRLWQRERISVAQEHYCTAATQLIMSQLYPYIFATEKNGRTLVAACVPGELHEIGMRMVSDFFELEGWDSYYLGANMPEADLISTLKERKAELLALSATLTDNVGVAARLIAAVRAADIGHPVRILVGGRPFTEVPDLWQRIGADGSGQDAEEALQAAERLALGPALGSRVIGAATPGLGPGRSPGGEWEARICDELSRVNNDLLTAQRELAKKNAELKKLNEFKDEFLGMAAHDLRNPLSVIVMYGQHLEHHPALRADPAQVKAISLINRSSRFMLQLLDDLLDIAKIEAGHLRLERGPTDLAALVEQSVALNAILAERRGIHLTPALAAGLPRVMLDSAKIEQVLNNLLSNAIKFSPPGGEIAVGLKRDGDHVLLSVADQGPGIPAGEMKDLFKAFARLSVRSATGEKSTGLGLAICRRIVEGHHGRIWAESQEGRGSTFCVALPV